MTAIVGCERVTAVTPYARACDRVSGRGPLMNRILIFLDSCATCSETTFGGCDRGHTLTPCRHTPGSKP